MLETKQTEAAMEPQTQYTLKETAEALADAQALLEAFAEDYERLAQ